MAILPPGRTVPVLEKRTRGGTFAIDTRNPTVIVAAVAAVVGLVLFVLSFARSWPAAPPRPRAEAVPSGEVTYAPPAPSPFPTANVTFEGPSLPRNMTARQLAAPAPRHNTPIATPSAPPPSPAPPARRERPVNRGAVAASAPAQTAIATPRFNASVDVVDSTIYNRSNAEVVPPVPVLPQQLGSLPPGARREDYCMIEVVLNEQGTVQSARVTDAPAGLGDTLTVTMSLSAVKAWQFLPAVRNGRPVRYRQLIPVSLR